MIGLAKLLAGLPVDAPVELDDGDYEDFQEKVSALDEIATRCPSLFIEGWLHAKVTCEADDPRERMRRLAVVTRRASVDAEVADGLPGPTPDEYWFFSAVSLLAAVAAVVLSEGAAPEPELVELAAATTDGRIAHWRELRRQAQFRAWPVSPPPVVVSGTARQSARAPRGRRVAAAAGSRSPPSSDDDPSDPAGLIPRVLRALGRWLR